MALTITASILTACGVRAYDLTLSTNFPPITFHGFGSQGFLMSSDYNYLDADTRNGSFRFSELGLNASINPFPRTRISVQGFDYDVGDVNQYEPFLDYAQIEYTFNDAIGMRAGRIRRPAGIYNHIQDVDLARTWVLLPEGVYDARWRDFYCSIDGGEFFGSIPLGKAGSLAYEAYAGMMNPSMKGGAAQVIRDEFYILDQQLGLDYSLFSEDSCPVAGLQLWYDTPLDGLRLGLTGAFVSNFGYTVGDSTSSAHVVDNIPFLQASVEYRWRSWTFQGEYSTLNFSGNMYYNNGYTTTDPSRQKEAWYVSAAYRFNKWLEAGGYYTEDYEDTSTADLSTSYQKDFALALRVDVTDWWLVKMEGHYIHGTGLLNDSRANPSQDNRGWFLLALKTTLSF